MSGILLPRPPLLPSPQNPYTLFFSQSLPNASTSLIMNPSTSTFPAPRPSPPLSIDLNQLPISPPLDSPSPVPCLLPPPQPPLCPLPAFPGEAGAGPSPRPCGACGHPELRGATVVCDGCERGFHIACVRMRPRHAGALEDWLCWNCGRSGGVSKRWPLGAVWKDARGLLDMNALPPSDGEGEGDGDGEASPCSTSDRLYPRRVDAITALPVQVSHFNMAFLRNGLGKEKLPLLDLSSVRGGFEDLNLHCLDSLKTFEDSILNSPLHEVTDGNSATLKITTKVQGETLHQALREYLLERRIILCEGWSVEFKPINNGCSAAVFFCSPEGRRFESMLDVANYLETSANASLMVKNDKSQGTLVQKGLLLRRRRPVRADNLVENVENVIGDHQFPSSDSGIVESHFEDNVQVVEAHTARDNDYSDVRQIGIDLPVQYENFFILSVGNIDSRPTYHSPRQIWPMGFRSCWHDELTGSFFTCEVSDGGDSGPLFKVWRSSCSAMSIPKGSTVILFSESEKLSGTRERELKHMKGYEEDDLYQIFSDPSPSLQDFASCFEFDSHQSSCPEHFHGFNPCSKDELGEFVIESRSTSSVWTLVTQKIVDSCREIYRQSGSFQVSCNHDLSLFLSDPGSVKVLNCTKPLLKFHSSEFKSASHGIRSMEELDSYCNSIEKWLDQDRFGLDLTFVLEMIENLPGVHTCFHYNVPGHTTGIYQSDGANLHVSKRSKYMREDSCGFNSKQEISFDQNLDKGLKLGCRALTLGRPLSRRLPADLVGDVLEIWELLSRFSESLELDVPLTFEDLERELIEPWFDVPNSFEKLQKGIEENKDIEAQRTGSNVFNLVPSFYQPVIPSEECHSDLFISVDNEHSRELSQAKIASRTYGRCMGVALTKIHIALLKVLLGELQCKVAAFMDPSDGGDTKLRRGRKREIDCAVPMKKSKINMLPINELTWPELAKRYILSYLAMDGKLDSVEYRSRECGKVFRCIQGDGGVLCGSLTGIAGMEADAVLLAEAERQICYLKREEEDFTGECKTSEINGANETARVVDGDLPEWAQLLEPVKKLPTNVGTRIRKCVYDALEKGPPDWAKKILEHSISKEVYKGNASGPTKKAVLSLLENLGRENQRLRPERRRKQNISNSVPKMIMKQCRITLRRAAAGDEGKTFCNLLGKSLLYPNDNEDEGLLGSPAMVSRPLDFRTIDLKLAAGAYGGSHEAFHEDVREVWQNICTAYRDRSDLMQLAEKLSQNFESLYDKEVLSLVNRRDERMNSESSNGFRREELDDLGINEIPKAPWEDGVCKVCGIDKDDDSVLLCDSCDSEYHTYCLDPPLTRIPEGNWYCPSCVKSQTTGQEVLSVPRVTGWSLKKRSHGEDTLAFIKALSDLVVSMGEREYWELTVRERTFLLRFLCNEALNLTAIRAHIDKCAEVTSDLQQRLRSLVNDWRNLKFREFYMSSRTTNETTRDVIISNDGCVDTKEKDENTSCDMIHEGSQIENGLNDSGNMLNDRKLMCLPCEPSSPMDVEMQNVDSISNTQRKLDNLCCGSDRNHYADGSLTPQEASNFSSTGMVKTLPSEQVSLIDCPHKSKRIPTAHNHSASEDKDMCEPQEACSLEASPLKTRVVDLEDRISPLKTRVVDLEDRISDLWSQLYKLALRRDFFGRDAEGNLYWALNSPRGCPWLAIGGSKSVQQNKAHCGHCVKNMKPEENGPTWVSILTDAEIIDLAVSLREDNFSERRLRQSISQWLQFPPTQLGGKSEHCKETLKFPSKHSNDGDDAYPSLVCKASSVLEKRYGSFCEPEVNDHPRKRGNKAKICNEERMFRCECLEPVWPLKHHCLFCHQTFCSASELEGHNGGRCMPGSAVLVEVKRAEKDPASVDDVTGAAWKKGRLGFSSGLIKFPREPDCPYNFEEISKKFIAKSSNKELVKEIGLIGLNGNPSFMPYSSAFTDQTLLSTSPAVEETYERQIILSKGQLGLPVSYDGADDRSLGRERWPCTGDKTCIEMTDGEDLRAEYASGQIQESESSQSFAVPEAALRSLTGRDSQILRRLKINLLDMEASVLDEALRPARGFLHRRCAWRAFVKTAETIFEMIQATFVFEDMIRPDHLRTEWWYWSSFSAAAKTSTLSALALRIYSLDTAIFYEKGSPTEALETSKVGKSGKRKRDGDG